MGKLKKFQKIKILFLIVLLFSVFFGFFGEFFQSKTAFLPFRTDTDNYQSDIDLRFLSERLILYNPVAAQNRNQANRLWRYILLFALFFMIPGTAGNFTPQKYRIHHYHYQKLFHNLIDSFSLGGRAPPRSA